MGLQSFGYAYDSIGNRTTAGRSGASSSYTANSLNQYSQRTLPGVIDLMGSASTQSVVTVNEQSTSRQDEYWYLDFLVTNIYNAVYTNLEITAVYTPPDTNDPAGTQGKGVRQGKGVSQLILRFYAGKNQWREISRLKTGADSVRMPP